MKWETYNSKQLEQMNLTDKAVFWIIFGLTCLIGIPMILIMLVVRITERAIIGKKYGYKI